MNFFMKFPSWLIFLLLLNSLIFAYDSILSEEDSTLGIGVQMGGNLTSLTGGNLDKMESFKNWGLNFGAYWNYSLNKFSDLILTANNPAINPPKPEPIPPQPNIKP